MEETISEITRKKEFNEIPKSIIINSLKIKDIQNKSGKEKIKAARAFLRKYFSIFITRRLVKGELTKEQILKKHISSCNRDYTALYKRLIDEGEVIVDLGAGLNGFSYDFFPRKISYLAIEAIGVFVNLMNNYFIKNKFDALAFQEDLFNLSKIKEIISNKKGKKILFLFNVIDALERIKKDYSKDLILELSGFFEKIVISFPTSSITGKSKFAAKRFWILNFLKNNFSILDEFSMNGEKFIVFKK